MENSLNLQDLRKRLKHLITVKAFQFSEEPVFRLVHGGLSCFYFNCKKVTLDPEGQYLIGHIIYEMIQATEARAIGGLTLGADPIALSVSYTSWLRGRPIRAFVVRKEPKEHGTMSQIEGNLQPGDKVVVVDDVITTGGSTIKAIKACRTAGLEVIKVVALVDREEMNGRGNIMELVADVEPIFTRTEIMDYYRSLSK
ncbi:orotate phosphoribosyltransferase [Thermodesulforhabdus norvegica]|uniref:Orotate phosphoribosyltransferase n=1 Tax=Thermodesulforhabdus norvegica TaxID=39841 RepID=A0A1I4QYN3_9BACT|nr:orotate phosphoribosyltransferase [Thermodesulforhabdus norvegica]SFM45101.1 orotate phosphoribosyltransferase [Thermodesulforhabdus norvegica]